MIAKSYTFRLVIMCAIGMLPILGVSGKVFAEDIGAIAGKVTGQRSNASVSGINVEVSDPSGKVVKSTVTQEDGSYVVPQLPVGQYDVKAGKAPVKSVEVAMSPPVTQVDFQHPEKGYLVFSGMSKNTKIVLGVMTAAAIGVGIYLIVDSSSSHDSP